MWLGLPLLALLHQNAEKEAEAAECVAQLGGNTASWNFSDKIYQRTTSNGTGFALTALGPSAKEVGVDQKKFQDCLDSGKNAKLVADEQAGGEAAGSAARREPSSSEEARRIRLTALSRLPPLNPRFTRC